MGLPNLEDVRQAGAVIYRDLAPTPQIHWPLLSNRIGAEVWVKHENMLPVGAFKIRGGLYYMHSLAKSASKIPGVITATRGNHGQSIAFAASKHGIRAVIVVPKGNSVSKNHAMQSLGAELIEHGEDFDTASEHARELACSAGLIPIASFDPCLVAGVATYALEFFEAVQALDAIYVPIGMGSGICGVIAMREALGLTTEVIGVVAQEANTYPLSVAAGHPVTTNSADTIADGLAVRKASPQALKIITQHAARIVEVSESEIRSAICCYDSDCHQISEGAAAAALAALMQERSKMAGKRVGVVLSGSNIDRELYLDILSSDRNSPRLCPQSRFSAG